MSVRDREWLRLGANIAATFAMGYGDCSYAEDGGFGGIALEELHQDVSKCEIQDSVPDGVRRSFDAARHAYIYSYFSYDLLNPAVSQLFACLELALRARLGYSPDGKTRAPGLSKLLAEATNKTLIVSDVSVLHKIRNVFQHGTEATIDSNMYLDLLGNGHALNT